MCSSRVSLSSITDIRWGRSWRWRIIGWCMHHLPGRTVSRAAGLGPRKVARRRKGIVFICSRRFKCKHFVTNFKNWQRIAKTNLEMKVPLIVKQCFPNGRPRTRIFSIRKTFPRSPSFFFRTLGSALLWPVGQMLILPTESSLILLWEVFDKFIKTI